MSANLESVAAQLASLERQKDSAYMERNQVVAALAKLFPAGVARTPIDGWDPAWTNCVFIDLPTGQASWHYHDSEAHLFAGLPPYAGVYDGHSTPEKYARLAALPGSAGWLMCGPDGSRFTGPTPYRAAAAANRHWTRLDPTAAQQLAEACAAIRSDVADAAAAPSSASEREAPEPVVPFLARDVAELLGISVPELSAALVALGMPERSQGMTIGPFEALAVRRAAPAPAPADAQHQPKGMVLLPVERAPLEAAWDAIEEMDQSIRICRQYQRTGEKCAEVNPEDTKRWRLAFSRVIGVRHG